MEPSHPVVSLFNNVYINSIYDRAHRLFDAALLACLMYFIWI